MSVSRPQYPTCHTCAREFTHVCTSEGSYCQHHDFTGFVIDCDTCRVSTQQKFLALYK